MALPGEYRGGTAPLADAEGVGTMRRDRAREQPPLCCPFITRLAMHSALFICYCQSNLLYPQKPTVQMRKTEAYEVNLSMSTQLAICGAGIQTQPTLCTLLGGTDGALSGPWGEEASCLPFSLD